MSDIAELYGLTSASGWSGPSTVDYDLYGDEPCTYCLATHKPGVCAGTKRGAQQAQPGRPGQVYQQPHVAVPVAPAAKTQQQGDMEQAAKAGYAAAYQHAQQLAQQLGADHGHATVQAAAGDYARALHHYGRATARADQLRDRASQRHDTAVARNQAIDRANAARQAAATTLANAQAKRQALHRAAVRHPRARSHHSIWSDEIALYALAIPFQFSAYGMVAAAHWGCGVGEFCRNPLHPGPCKGWKHMLHSVAPGAYHAYEKQRVAKLNEARKAKIAALKAAGKPIPKKLLQEITYAPVPTKPPESQFVPPTPKEAQSKLPATAKEIGQKIALKHAAIAKDKTDKQAEAITSAVAAVFPVTTVGNKKAKEKAAEIVATLKPGEKLSEHPLVENTIKEIVDKAEQMHGSLTSSQKLILHQDIAAHIDQGIPEVPQTLQSVVNDAKQKAKAAKVESQTNALHNIAVAVGATNDTPEAKDAFGKAVQVANDKATEGQKITEVAGVSAVVNYLAQKANGQLTQLHDQLGKTGPGITEVHKQLAEHIDEGKPGLPPVVAQIPDLEKQAKAKADMEAVKAKLAVHGTGRAAGKLTPTGKTLGTHGATVAKDETGKEFLVKPADFTGHAEVGASKLAAAVGLTTPQVHKHGAGTAQEIVPGGKDAFPGKHFDPVKLSQKDILDLQKHHVLDWLIGNHDAHPGNFLRDKNGNLVEIDKGQAFKHYAEDSLSSGYHPNAAYGEQEPVYNTLLKAAKAGKVQLNDPGTGELGDFIKKVQGLPNDKLKAMFRPYAEEAAKAGKLPGAPNGGKIGESGANPAAVDGFLDKIVDRKDKLGTAFTALHAKHQPSTIKITEVKPTSTVSKAAKAKAEKITAGQDLADEAKKILGQQGMSLTTKADKLSKEHFDALPKDAQDKLIGGLKDIEGDAGHEVSLKATGLIEKFTGEKPPISLEKSKGVTPAAPLSPDAPAHVKHAQSLATGATYGTAKAKIGVYEKLSQDEYHSLPIDVQESIHEDLHAAHAKFLDPKKKTQVQAILNKLGAPVASPAGAGAPHEKVPKQSKSAQMAAAHVAAMKLAGKEVPPGLEGHAQDSYETHHGAQDIQHAADSIADGWADHHLHGLGLKPSEQLAIKNQAASEIKKMISEGKTEPPSGGVLHVVAKYPAGGTTKGKADLLKFAADLPESPKVGAGAGGTAVVGGQPLTGTPAQVAAKHHAAYKAAAILSGGTGTSSQSTAQKFEQAKNAGTLTQQIDGSANAVASSFMTKQAPQGLSDADAKKLKAKVAEEAHQMIITGSEKPPIGGVLEAVQKGANPVDVLKAAGIKAPEPGKVSPGGEAYGVTHAKGGKLVSDPHGSKGFQVVSTGQATKVNAWNKKVEAATKGTSGHSSAPLSISKIEAMYSTSMGGKNGTKFGDVLASKSKGALHAYSGSQYIDINGYLRRKAKGEHVGETYVKANEPLVKAMDAAFQHSPAKSDILVYRGIHDAASSFGDAWLPDKSMAGVEFTEPGYSSTSTSKGVGFGGGISGAKFRILVPKGTPAISMHGGQHSGEDEILLPRGTKFRIVADNGYQNGTRMLDVEVIPA